MTVPFRKVTVPKAKLYQKPACHSFAEGNREMVVQIGCGSSGGVVDILTATNERVYQVKEKLATLPTVGSLSFASFRYHDRSLFSGMTIGEQGVYASDIIELDSHFRDGGAYKPLHFRSYRPNKETRYDIHYPLIFGNYLSSANKHAIAKYHLFSNDELLKSAAKNSACGEELIRRAGNNIQQLKALAGTTPYGHSEYNAYDKMLPPALRLKAQKLEEELEIKNAMNPENISALLILANNTHYSEESKTKIRVNLNALVFKTAGTNVKKLLDLRYYLTPKAKIRAINLIKEQKDYSIEELSTDDLIQLNRFEDALGRIKDLSDMWIYEDRLKQSKNPVILEKIQTKYTTVFIEYLDKPNHSFDTLTYLQKICCDRKDKTLLKLVHKKIENTLPSPVNAAAKTKPAAEQTPQNPVVKQSDDKTVQSPVAKQADDKTMGSSAISLSHAATLFSGNKSPAAGDATAKPTIEISLADDPNIVITPEF